MGPTIDSFNLVAIGSSVAATFVFGFIWYTIIFGKAWAHEMGFDPDEEPNNAVMIRGVLFMVFGNLFLALVLSHNMAALDPVTWNQEPGSMAPWLSGLLAAVFTWLGFFLPVDLSSVAWEKKSWKLFGINTGYHFISVLLVAMLIAML